MDNNFKTGSLSLVQDIAVLVNRLFSLDCWISSVFALLTFLSFLLIDLKKVVVAVTDGFSSLGIQNTKELTDRLKTNNIKLFSVGSSDRLNRLNKPELEMMASKPSEIHQLIVDSFSKHQVEQFSKKICNSK